MKKLRSDAVKLGELSEKLMHSYAKTTQLYNTIDTMVSQFETITANNQAIRNTAVESAWLNNQILSDFRDYRSDAIDQIASLNINYQNITINEIQIRIRDITTPPGSLESRAKLRISRKQRGAKSEKYGR